MKVVGGGGGLGWTFMQSENWIVLSGDNVRRGYDRVEGSIGRSYDEIKGVTMSVSSNLHMLSEITTGKKVEKFDCLSIAEVVMLKDIEGC